MAATAFASVLLVGLASVLAYGIAPWQDYVDYVRNGGGVDLATWVNISPASIIGLVSGNHDIARPIGVLTGLGAIAAALWAARAIDDDLESFFVAALASLVLLPITWYHYPVALIPLAVAAWSRSRGTSAARRTTAGMIAALVVADVVVPFPVGLWIAVAILVWTVRGSRPARVVGRS